MKVALNAVRKLLPSRWQHPRARLREAVHSAQRCVQMWLAVPASRSGFLASIYYAFFSRRFDREHRAVLAGLVWHAREPADGATNSSRLRRAVHRLEKGLGMRHRRASFGEDYIEEAVALFATCRARPHHDPAELEWAGDVLRMYFRVVEDTPTIAHARERFARLGVEPNASLRVPYASRLRRASPVEYDALLDLFRERRSVRWFTGDRVDSQAVLRAIDAASLAPSACNRQPYFFIVLNEPQRASRVAALAGGTAGFSDGIPCLIVIVGDQSSFAEERDRHLIYIDGALAAMQFMLALQVQGLSSCPINWPDIEVSERALQRELSLGNHERPVMMLAVGYADPEGYIPYSQKKPASSLTRDPAAQGVEPW